MLQGKDRYFWKRYRSLKAQSDLSAARLEKFKAKWPKGHTLIAYAKKRAIHDKGLLDSFVTSQMR
jgi:hypothetical protein